MNWYLHALKNYATFSGRATRSEFWFFMLFNIIISICLGIIGLLFDETNVLSGILQAIYSLAVLIPNIAVSSRRLHDINKSGWWQLIIIIPLIGAILLLIYYCTDSKEDNKYGINPKQSSNINNLGNDALFQLEKLSELKDKGIITQEEFEIKKKQILG